MNNFDVICTTWVTSTSLLLLADGGAGSMARVLMDLKERSMWQRFMLKRGQPNGTANE
jgi:hypothetical protein